MGDRIKLRVILGSTRQGRLGDKLAKWIHDLAKERGDLDVELLDLRDYPLPFLGEEARSASEPADKLIAAWATKVSEADGFIIATAEYNHGYPAVLKNALDSIKNEWSNKPVAFVSWGGVSGGARAVEQLRQVVVELQMVPIRNAVHIPFVWNLMDDDG
ncbi:MAG: NAD(P)H-dependent oxidoreductase, partial [Patescibacteria group bacterium]|nr:NAD(P)H-dependent oxidoreductase [Patescibacteria group bacterium]